MSNFSLSGLKWAASSVKMKEVRFSSSKEKSSLPCPSSLSAYPSNMFRAQLPAYATWIHLLAFHFHSLLCAALCVYEDHLPSTICKWVRWWKTRRYPSLWLKGPRSPCCIGQSRWKRFCSQAAAAERASWKCREIDLVGSGAGEGRRIWRWYWSWVFEDVACLVILQELGKVPFACVILYQADFVRCGGSCMSGTGRQLRSLNRRSTQRWLGWSIVANLCTNMWPGQSRGLCSLGDVCPHGWGVTCYQVYCFL